MERTVGMKGEKHKDSAAERTEESWEWEKGRCGTPWPAQGSGADTSGPCDSIRGAACLGVPPWSAPELQDGENNHCFDETTGVEEELLTAYTKNIFNKCYIDSNLAVMSMLRNDDIFI